MMFGRVGVDVSASALPDNRKTIKVSIFIMLGVYSPPLLWWD